MSLLMSVFCFETMGLEKMHKNESLQLHMRERSLHFRHNPWNGRAVFPQQISWGAVNMNSLLDSEANDYLRLSSLVIQLNTKMLNQNACATECSPVLWKFSIDINALLTAMQYFQIEKFSVKLQRSCVLNRFPENPWHKRAQKKI